MINAVSRYIGGIYVDRSFPPSQTTTKPYTPVPYQLQKKAMQVLHKFVFAPNAFNADAYLYPYLQPQRRGFNFISTTEDPKLSTMYLLLANAALGHILHPITMQRINNTEMYGNRYSLTAIMEDLSRGIFDDDLNGNVNTYRKYLQIALVKSLANLADPKMNYDDPSKAASRYALKKLKQKLTSSRGANEETKAQRNYLIFLIDEVLTVK